MALPATGVWEVETTGNDNNGGMFDPSVTSPGTDYTYGAGQTTFAYTDLVVDAVTSTKVTSATRSFIAADVGNTIQITAGFTTGFYNIRSVSGGAATLDRSPAAVGTTGGTGTLGGALASPGKAAGAAVSENLIWCKAGTYSITSTTSNASGGLVTIGGRVLLRGYNATRGDDGTPPLLQASGISSTTLVTLNGTSAGIWNVKIDGANLTSIRGCDLATFVCFAYRVTAINCKNSGIVTSSATDTRILFCRANGCSTAGAGFTLAGGLVFGCEADANSVSGFDFTGSPVSAAFCLSHDNTGASSHGYKTCRNALIANCTAYNNGGSGFYEDFNIDRCKLINIISYGNGRYGTEMTVATDNRFGLFLNCAYGNNTSGTHSNAPYADLNAITLTASPFTNAASGDFSLNNTAGGGAMCRAAGIPGAFPGGLTTGYLDIGAVQHQDSGGGMTFVECHNTIISDRWSAVAY